MKIKVPATSANIGSGFDALGIALTMYNEIEIEESDFLDIISLDDIQIPTNEDNLIFQSACRLYQECGKPVPKGMKIRQTNVVPMARGLGSSSTCVAAGLIGANEILGSPLNRDELVNIACSIEGHPDNTTPALLGGLTAAAVENDRVYAVTLHVADKFRFAAFIPNFELKTSVARGVLPQSVSRDDAVYNLSRSALMAGSLATGNTENLHIADLIRRSLTGSLTDDDRQELHEWLTASPRNRALYERILNSNYTQDAAMTTFFNRRKLSLRIERQHRFNIKHCSHDRGRARNSAALF